jgi:predicted amidophosphoribosyltransferase
MRERRFNQAEMIAAAALPHLPFRAQLRPDLLIRKRPTVSQTGLTRHQRRENVRGAFTVPHRRLSAVKGSTIIVIDDVFTTGTTVEECARVLKRAGAASVWVATVARVAKLEVTQNHPMLQHSGVTGQAARA